MPPEIVVRDEASEEIVDQTAYYHRAGTPATADRWVARVDATVNRLAAFPGTGEPLSDPLPRLAGVRIGRIDDFPGHIIVYRPFDVRYRDPPRDARVERPPTPPPTGTPVFQERQSPFRVRLVTTSEVRPPVRR